MPVVILELDANANIKYLNPYGCKLFGYASLEEMKGKNWIELTVSPEERSQLTTSYKKYFSGNVPTAETRFTNLTRDGQTRTIQWSSVLFTDNYIGNSSVLTIGVDTTDLEKAFRQLEVLKNELQKENIFLKDVNSDETETEIIGKSEAIIYAIQKARQVSGTHATVLLEGETGVGKELFANLIHKMSERCEMPLIKVNCAALPDELIESELFGHEKGSFTGALQARKGRFELAHGGTIFLDEIGEMPLSLQPKLLRVLQSGEFERIGGQHTIKVDVRLISATNKDLLTDVRQGKFREDLYYRLNVYPITIPSLRDRKEDIPVLVDHFISKYSIEFNKSFENISKGDLNRLTEYDWPGNIRELINLIERSVISSSGGTLKIMWEPHGHNGNGNGHIEYVRQDYSIRDLEKDHILRVLRESRWKINGENGAAERLGLNPNTLRSRMKKLNIVREES
jgi:PAS domain S-box-containing protein